MILLKGKLHSPRSAHHITAVTMKIIGMHKYLKPIIATIAGLFLGMLSGPFYHGLITDSYSSLAVVLVYGTYVYLLPASFVFLLALIVRKLLTKEERLGPSHLFFLSFFAMAIYYATESALGYTFFSNGSPGAVFMDVSLQGILFIISLAGLHAAHYYVARIPPPTGRRVEGFENTIVGGADSSRKEPAQMPRGLPRGRVHVISDRKKIPLLQLWIAGVFIVLVLFTRDVVMTPPSASDVCKKLNQSDPRERAIEALQRYGQRTPDEWSAVPYTYAEKGDHMLIYSPGIFCTVGFNSQDRIDSVRFYSDGP